MRNPLSVLGLAIAFVSVLMCAPLGCFGQGENRTPVPIVLGAETRNIDITLQRGGSISGHVHYAGSPPPDANVAVIAFAPAWQPINTTITKADGRSYTIPGLPTGSYYVQAIRLDVYTSFIFYDGSATREGANAVQVVAGQDTPNIDLTFPLLPGGKISGHVYETDGVTPVKGASVTAMSMTGGYGFATTDPTSGSYTISGLSAGMYFVSASATGYGMLWYPGVTNPMLATQVQVNEGAHVQNIDFRLPRTGTASLSGTVYRADNDSPLQGIYVQLEQVGGTDSFSSSTRTASGGHYSFAGLPGGEYFVRAGTGSEYAPRFYLNSPTKEGATRVSVADGTQVTGIDIRLPLGGSISGRIVDEVTGAPLAGIVVSAFTSGQSPSEGNSALTDAGGFYTIKGLDTGDYYVLAGTYSPYVPEYYFTGTQFRIESVRATAAGFVLRWTSTEGRRYKVAASTQLSSWSDISPTINAATGQSFTEWQDSNAFTFPRRFYRVQELQ